MISSDEFEEIYKPLQTETDELLRFYNQTTMFRTEYVWSILETGDGNLYAVAGYRIVNCVGYVVTTVPWPDIEAEAIWHEGEPS